LKRRGVSSVILGRRDFQHGAGPKSSGICVQKKAQIFVAINFSNVHVDNIILFVLLLNHCYYDMLGFSKCYGFDGLLFITIVLMIIITIIAFALIHIIVMTNCSIIFKSLLNHDFNHCYHSDLNYDHYYQCHSFVLIIMISLIIVCFGHHCIAKRIS